MMSAKYAPTNVTLTFPRAIVVNGEMLDAARLTRLGVAPSAVRPGHYWYDARSGLAGLVGGPAQAVVAANLPLAPMDPCCSNGTSGYFLNGRQLTLGEVQWLVSVVGWIPPGRYFVNSNGDAGTEGGPVAVNLVQASRRGQRDDIVSRGMFTTTSVGADNTVTVRDASGGASLSWPF